MAQIQESVESLCESLQNQGPNTLTFQALVQCVGRLAKQLTDHEVFGSARDRYLFYPVLTRLPDDMTDADIQLYRQRLNSIVAIISADNCSEHIDHDEWCALIAEGERICTHFKWNTPWHRNTKTTLRLRGDLRKPGSNKILNEGDDENVGGDTTSAPEVKKDVSGVALKQVKAQTLVDALAVAIHDSILDIAAEQDARAIVKALCKLWGFANPVNE